MGPGHIIVGAEGYIASCNEAAGDILGFPAYTAPGFKLVELIARNAETDLFLDVVHEPFVRPPFFRSASVFIYRRPIHVVCRGIHIAPARLSVSIALVRLDVITG